MASVSTEVDFPVSPDEFYDVLTNFDALPDFISGLESITVIDDTADAWVVEHVVRVMKQFTYTLAFRGTRGASLSWTQVEGPFKKNEGLWTLEPGDSGGTHATYSMTLEVGLFVPRSIERGLVKNDLPRLMGDWRKAADARGSAP